MTWRDLTSWRRCVLMAGALALFSGLGCGYRASSRAAHHPSLQAAHDHQETSFGFPHFREVGLSAGLHYQWTIPGSRPMNILQTIGNGCAFLDYNNDGNLDILLVGPDHVALYQGDGHGHFTDVSHQTGLDRLKGHFLGCAVGDYDNDGYDDIYLSGYRTGLLLHNEPRDKGGGESQAAPERVFRDVRQEMGLKPLPLGASCRFADLDGDGYLHLYVTNYVRFDPKKYLVLC